MCGEVGQGRERGDRVGCPDGDGGREPVRLPACRHVPPLAMPLPPILSFSGLSRETTGLQILTSDGVRGVGACCVCVRVCGRSRRSGACELVGSRPSQRGQVWISSRGGSIPEEQVSWIVLDESALVAVAVGNWKMSDHNWYDADAHY